MTYFFVILFIALIAYVIYFTVVRARTVVNSPYNQRQDSLCGDRSPGGHCGQKRERLATTTVGDDGSETRSYPYGIVFSHVVGYSDSDLGNTGLESVENFELLTSQRVFP